MLLYEFTYASNSSVVVGFTAAHSSVDCKSLLSCFILIDFISVAGIFLGKPERASAV